MQRILQLTLASVIILSAQAEEHTVTEKPFRTESTLNAVFLPEKFTSYTIKPNIWTDFTISSLVSQGAQVKKGATLIGIDTKHIDKNIAEAEKSRISATLALAQAKHELAQLKIATPRNLEASARNEKQTAEDLKWYIEIGHPKEIEVTKRSIKSAELRLAYQQEELKQLLKMYGEDNKTEETEEIILKRTRNSVEQAEFALKAAKIEVKRSLAISIPRKLKAMQRTSDMARIANAAAQEQLPRALKLKQLTVAKAERDDKKSIENLAQLKADRTMMNITAPADGVVYYGSMHQGSWNPAAAAKVLKIGGKLPNNTSLMTFIPADSPLQLSAFATDKQLTNLAAGAKGFAISNLNRYRSIPVSISSLATYPKTDGTYHVALKPTLGKADKIVPGMKATIQIQGQKFDKALVVPANFLSRQPDGSYSVKLKLANGKTDNRAVTIGASNKDSAIITKGIEKGQVIVK